MGCAGTRPKKSSDEELGAALATRATLADALATGSEDALVDGAALGVGVAVDGAPLHAHAMSAMVSHEIVALIFTSRLWPYRLRKCKSLRRCASSPKDANAG